MIINNYEDHNQYHRPQQEISSSKGSNSTTPLKIMMKMMMMLKMMKTYHENDQPAAGSDSAKPCTFGEIRLANSGDWVFLGVRGFRCKLRSWTLLLVLHGGSRSGLSSIDQI